MKVIVAVTGASGIIYGVRLVEELNKKNVETHVIFTEAAKKTAEYELKDALKRVKASSKFIYSENEIDAPPASGSNFFHAMIIAPCSIRTLGSIANGIADNLVTRAALVQLKERRSLILLLRETPISTIDILNMLKVSIAGATIMPASPAFYHNPNTIDDLVNFIVGKILDLLGIQHNLYKKWKE